MELLVTLTLWPAFGLYRDSSFFLCGYGEKRMIFHDVVCNAFVFNGERCDISCFTWNRFIFFWVTFLSIFVLTSWHSGFDGWCLVVGWCCYHWSHLSRFGFMGSSILRGCCNNHHFTLKMTFYCNWYLTNMLFSLVIKIFGCLYW
jgi:hypothetical protein